MYLSRLRIRNYRSIKELDLDFQKGKNVIVGKNNSGKNNIVKAVDILLGESSPAYQKLENITQGDFHNGNTEENILLFCVLERDDSEDLCYEEMYKCFGYKRHDAHNGYPKKSFRHNIRTNLSHFWDDLNNAMDISDQDNGTYTSYIATNPKAQQNNTLENEFSDKFIFAFAFRAQYTGENRIQKEIRFFYKEHKSQNWIMSFTAPIRNEFIQSAIIPSFRDPARELRVNSWSWYGKLLRNYTEYDNAKLINAFQDVKNASNEIFKELREEINDSKVKVAFPETTVSFQFNPEAKFDFYKNAMIYVNDGHDSPLQEKGAGIQSAVIIGLFNYYTKKVAHTSCSLLAIEEPELFLHPQARRVMANRLDDFIDDNKHQVIITTHSTEFITSAHENINIILAKKDENKSTIAKNVRINTSKEKQILLKIQNSEMFFADHVLLVEGGEKYIVEAIAKHYGSNIKPHLGANWLNEKNFSVISVGGKSEFHKYYKKLKDLEISVHVLADFDFFLRMLSEFLTSTNASEESRNTLNSLKGKLNTKTPEIAKEVVQQLTFFKDFLSQRGYSIDEKDIKNKIRDSLRIKKLNQLKTDAQQEVTNYIEKLRENNIFILKGELEDYYTDKCLELLHKVGGKEEKPIHICSNLLNSMSNELDLYDITDLIKVEEYICLFDLITKDFAEPQEEIVDSGSSEDIITSGVCESTGFDIVVLP